ncbi:MAG: amidase family protein, partial [Chloroflexi bacterium]|nr:amidase family protein [Chloroflexota bacterium]
DLLLMPTLATGAFEIDSLPEKINGRAVGDRRWGFIAYTYFFNLTGNPASSVPCGFDDEGMPIGLQIIGGMRDEVRVLAASAAFEAARPWAGKVPETTHRG